jgi:hypothetical protein
MKGPDAVSDLYTRYPTKFTSVLEGQSRTTVEVDPTAVNVPGLAGALGCWGGATENVTLRVPELPTASVAVTTSVNDPHPLMGVPST